MTDKHCILTGVAITPDNDSDAHIIPSALGGRLKPKGLLTSQANTFMNDRLDAPLIRALMPLMSLVDGQRDRGKNQPLVMSTPDGTKYRVSPDKAMTLDAPVYKETPMPEGTRVEIRARDMREAEHLLRRAKAQHPQVDLQEGLANAQLREEYLPDYLHGQLELGPNRIFPGVFGMANMYAAHLGQAPHSEFVSYTNGVPLRRGASSDGVPVPMPPDTFYWMPEESPYYRDPGIDHLIAYVGNPETSEALVVIALFNLPAIAVKLPFAGTAPVVYHYAVDVLTGQDKAVQIQLEEFLVKPWVKTHDTQDMFKHLGEALEPILKHSVNKSRTRELERIIEEELAGETVITAAAIGRISGRVARMMITQMNRTPRNDVG